MNNVTTQLLFLVGYTAVFALVCVAFWVWRIKRRGEKPPVEFKLLRGPGESLRRRMAKSDEELIFIVGGAALAPIIAERAECSDSTCRYSALKSPLWVISASRSTTTVWGVIG